MREQEILNALDDLGAETSEALDRLSGNTSLYLRLIKDFFSGDPLKDLQESIFSHDYPKALSASHALKGVLLNLSLLSLADEAIMMLQSYRAGKNEEAENLFPEFLNLYNDYKKAITPLFEE